MIEGLSGRQLLSRLSTIHTHTHSLCIVPLGNIPAGQCHSEQKQTEKSEDKDRLSED